MIITTVVVTIEPSIGDDASELSRYITLQGGMWAMPKLMYPREIRFAAALEDLVRMYNNNNKRGKTVGVTATETGEAKNG